MAQAELSAAAAASLLRHFSLSAGCTPVSNYMKRAELKVTFKPRSQSGTSAWPCTTERSQQSPMPSFCCSRPRWWRACNGTEAKRSFLF